MIERFKLTPPSNPSQQFKIERHIKMTNAPKYNFVKIKSDIIHTFLEDGFKDGMTSTQIRTELNNLYPDIKWVANRIADMVMETGKYLTNDEGQFYEINEMLNGLSGRWFSVNWETQVGYERKMTAKLLPASERQNGRYTRIVSSRDPNEIRNLTTANIKTIKIRGTIYKGRIAA